MSCIRSTALVFISIKRLMKLESMIFSLIFRRAWKQTFCVPTDLLLVLNCATRKVEILSLGGKFGSPCLEYHFMRVVGDFLDLVYVKDHSQVPGLASHVSCLILIWRSNKRTLLKTECNVIVLALDPKYQHHVRSMRWMNNIPVHASIQRN